MCIRRYGALGRRLLYDCFIWIAYWLYVENYWSWAWGRGPSKLFTSLVWLSGTRQVWFFFYEELIFIVNGLAFFLFEFLISMFEWVLLRAWFIMFVGRKDLGVPPKYESQNLSVNGLRLLYAIVAIFWRKCRCRLVSIYLFGARWWWQHADDCWKRCKGIMPAAALVQLITVQLLEYNQGINPALAYPPRLPTFHWIQGTDCGSSITHHVFACMHEWYSGSTYNVVCHSSPSWMLHNYL